MYVLLKCIKLLQNLIKMVNNLSKVKKNLNLRPTGKTPTVIIFSNIYDRLSLENKALTVFMYKLVYNCLFTKYGVLT